MAVTNDARMKQTASDREDTTLALDMSPVVTSSSDAVVPSYATDTPMNWLLSSDASSLMPGATIELELESSAQPYHHLARGRG